MNGGWISRLYGATLAVAVMSMATAALGQTQGPPRALQVKPLGTVSAWPSKAKRWALVIGVDRYADTQITTLGGSSNDAKSIVDALVRNAGFPPDQVILLASDQPAERQPTRGNILRRLSNLAQVVPHDGLLFLSFAGHGMERNNEAFLLPADAQVSNDVDLLEETAINVKQMKKRIHETGVGQVVLVLDACRNDPAGRGDKDNPLTATYLRGFNFDVANREVTAFATLYATSVGGRAYEYAEKHQGYFTWELVQGLKGAAANDKGEVTLSGLLNYVQGRVPKQVLADLGSGKDQKPFAVIGGYQADQLVIAVASPRTTPATSAAAAAAATTAGATSLSTMPEADPAAFEITYWDTIKNSTDPEDFKSYLAKYPNGQFADLARRRSQARNSATKSTDTRSTSTPTTMPIAPTAAAPKPQQKVLLLSNVFILGLNLGVAEIGAYQNTSNEQLLQYLGTAHDTAVSTGVATDQVDYLLNQLRSGAASQSQYQGMLSARQSLEQTLNRNGNCGRAVNLRYIFLLGAQQGFMEVVAYQGGDPNYLTQIINTAIQYAAASGLPANELQAILRQVSSGRGTRDQYQPLLNLRARLIQSINVTCAW
jgi:Caspase domain